MSIILDSVDEPRLKEILLDGGVVVLPTYTLYGLVCSAANESSVKRLYSLKKRDHKPGTVIASSTEQLIDLGLKARYLKPVEQYWPGPISIIIPCSFSLPYLHLGVGSLAVRIVADNKLKKLLGATGPLLTSSANLTGQPEAATVADAQKYFGDKVDAYVDGGDRSHAKPSTVIRIVDDMVEVLREGAVKINDKGEIIT